MEMLTCAFGCMCVITKKLLISHMKIESSKIIKKKLKRMKNHEKILTKLPLKVKTMNQAIAA